MDVRVLDGDDSDTATMTSTAAIAELRDVQQLECRLAARKAAVIDRARTSRAHRVDGYRSPFAWVRAEQNCSPATAGREVQRAVLLAALPAIAAELRDGRLGVDQVDLLARLWANKRVRPDLQRIIPVLIGIARTLPFDDLTAAFDRFNLHADPDGSDHSHDNARNDRRAHASFVGTSFVFDAAGDTLTGAQFIAILHQFEQAEFDRDWADAKAIHGDNTSGADLARTKVQRRYDAVIAMALAAAQAGTVTIPDTLVNLVIDADTFNATVHRTTGHTEPHTNDTTSADVAYADSTPSEDTHTATDPSTPPRSGYRRSGDYDDPATWFWRRSETINGIPIDPRQIVTAAIIGHIRRVITDPHTGTVTNLGRRQRLFRGAARDAVLLSWLHCFQPGCTVPNIHCHIDHTTPYSEGGPTDTTNGQPGCAHDNRNKHTHNFTTVPDPDGYTHVHRPDGTEVAPTRRGKPPP